MRGIIATCLALLVLVSVPGAHAKRRGVRPNAGRSKGGRHSKRSVPLPARPNLGRRNNDKSSSATAPFVNIWSQLSNDEAAKTIAFLHAQPPLNLTAAENATSFDNQIVVVESLMPNKSLALTYLNSESDVPQRYARVSIIFGATDEPNAYLREYSVGPLNGGQMFYKELNWQTTKGTTKQPIYDLDDALYDWTLNISATVANMTLDVLNMTVTGSEEDDNGEIWGQDPVSVDDGIITRWLGYWRYPLDVYDEETLLPQGLYMLQNITGRDPSGWRLLGWFINQQFFETTDQLLDAWKAGNFSLLRPNMPYERDGVSSWGGTDMTNRSLFMDELPAPRMDNFGQSRFVVDHEHKWVRWQDFSFYVSFSRDTGMRLFDIKYKNDTIMYELGLDEALAHYAGSDPVQANVGYLDTYYGFGPYAFQAIEGYDCPVGSTYLDTTFHADEKSVTHTNSICLFEFEEPTAMQRHSTSRYISVSRNVAFYMRSISTVGNYDYTFDYIFTSDGAIEVKVSASGYIQSASWPAGTSSSGYRINEALCGSIHDHVLVYKVDLDVAGLANSFAIHAITPVSQTFPWSGGKMINTMKLERRHLATEDEGRLDWPMNSGAIYSVVNRNATNKWGEARGYRIAPGVGSAHLTVQNSTLMRDSAHFADTHLGVAVRKDSEPRAAHAWNAYSVDQPIIDFAKFFDGESLDQVDLVVYSNLGMHHVPHTGDLPNTVTTTARSSFIISPHNYLLSDPSRATRQQIRIDYDDDVGVTEVHSFGQAEIPSLSMHSIDYSTLKINDVSVRKFPYRPLNPFNDTTSIVRKREVADDVPALWT